jgi:tetratricopeptide (TPR) repeat protein
MKMIRIIAVLSLALGGLVAANPPVDAGAAKDLHDKVDALMEAQRGEEAADLLQKALEDNPDDSAALRKLGGIYTLILKQPEKGAPLLERGFKLGDTNCLKALAIAQITMKDAKGILAYKKHYIDNFENLSGSKVVCFYIAGMERDGGLFNELLRKTKEEEIERDKGLCLMIARTAKALVEDN